MIVMNCPACGAEGRAPKEKVNTRLVCRKCLRAFYLTPSGRAVAGDPPTPGSRATATPEEQTAADRTKSVDRILERLSKGGLILWRTVAVALGMIALVIAVSLVLSRHKETLQERVTKVAQAALDADVHTVAAFASEGTKDDVVQWYDSVRERCNLLKLRLGSGKAKVDVEIKEESPDQDGVDVVVRLSSDENLDRKAGGALPDPSLAMAAPESGQTLTLPMTWRSETWSGWRMDGRLTLLRSLAGPGQVVRPDTEKSSERGAP
jgi:hypothetical protein